MKSRLSARKPTSREQYFTVCRFFELRLNEILGSWTSGFSEFTEAYRAVGQRCWVFWRLLRHVSRSANQCSPRMLGTQQYSPPFVVAKWGRPFKRRRIGRRGIVNVPVPSFVPASGSFSPPRFTKSPSLCHCDLTNSNWRERCAPPQ